MAAVGSGERMLRRAYSYTQRRWAHRRGGFVTGSTSWSKPPPRGLGPAAGAGAKKSEWWAVDGEMHEIEDGVPHSERFAIPRDNLPNRRRKQMREQFMRRTRLVIKDSEHETWCKKYMELYQELRENWERLYWDEGYSKKIAESHANYDSAEEDDLDFSPYSRRRQSNLEPNKSLEKMANGKPNVSKRWSTDNVIVIHYDADLGFGVNKQGETWERVTQIRDKFEYDRERRIRERAFAPMESNFGRHDPRFRNQDDSNFAPTNVTDDIGSHGQTFGNRSDRSLQSNSSFRNTRDSSFQNESRYRNHHSSDFQNESSYRNHHSSDFQNESSFRNHHYPDFQNHHDARGQTFDD